MKSADIRKDVLNRLRQWRVRLVTQRLVFTLMASSVLVALARLLETPLTTLLLQLVLLFLLSFAQLIYGGKWRQLIPDNFLQHLNRRFSDLEESAQLLILDDSDLSPMRRLQRSRVHAVYADNVEKLEQWQPPVIYRLSSAITLVFVLVAFNANQLQLLAENLLSKAPSYLTSADAYPGSTQITHMSITVQPPEYTGLPTTESRQGDMEVAEGSLVHWDLAFSTTADQYFLKLSDGQQIGLEAGENNHWHAKRVITSSDLYRIIEQTAGQESIIGDIYTLTVMLDKAPDIRTLEPVTSTLEIPKQGPASFSSSVLIQDDYGIQSAKILASVAKGSGEGVKFRDQTLVFDQTTHTGKGVLYQREWNLQTLGMEPGDEIYFAVVATDNKQPVANTGRSETIIVRWLDDEKGGLAAEGLAIDFIPEFFKSQRQIIIETEQLLEDEKNLKLQAFKDTSYEIGQAQADLKHKYGQYLGDEFGEGPGEQLGIMHEIAEAQADGNNTGESETHEHEEGTSINARISTTAEILDLFGHDHGDPEIGPITKRNPVALMKRAVNEMWQAEKHLMQAEPKQALPFEYEAYKYLKLARQADRIYVKRLGFEPPPVTEDRRLTGELDEILSYQTSENTGPENQTGSQADQFLLREAYDLISTQTPHIEFSAENRALLTHLSAYFMTLSQQRPALIKQAATVEKLLQTGQLKLENCPDCIGELSTNLWNLMDEGAALLHQGTAAFYINDGLIESYQDNLSKSSPGAKSKSGQP